MMDSNRNKNEPIPDFQSLPDEEICLLAGAGNAAAEEELVRRYGRLVRACARPLFLAGGDSEDLFQEGMLGLLTAIRSFEGGRDASFRTFAEICIRSRLYRTNAYLFSSEESPEDVIIGREELRERLDALKGQLSEFEASILSPYLSGLSCGEIARRVGRSPKAVDNAVQRIRRKVARNFSSSGSSES